MPELDVQATAAIDNTAGMTSVRGIHETNTPRRLNLLIQRQGERFRLRVLARPGDKCFPEENSECDLPLTPARLWGAVQRCRAAWRTSYVDAVVKNARVYQDGWDFKSAPPVPLGPAAVAGRQLFYDVFFPDEADEDPAFDVLTKIGEALQDATTQAGLCIRVTSDEFFAPWNLMYTRPLTDMRDGKDAVADGFLGYAHMVEHLPERSRPDAELGIDAGAPVRVAMYVDDAIDRTLGVRCVAAVRELFAAYEPPPGVLAVASRTTSAELLTALAQTPLDDHVLYFCCHAQVDGDGTRIVPDDAYVALTDNAYHVGPAQMRATMGRNKFTAGPIVFVNACQTAQMNSLFYQGFVPVFLNRHASAFVGTQTEIPAVFAGEFARRFFDRLFEGGSQHSAGRVLFDLRREFLDRHGNALGMLYSIYGGADAHVRNALPRR